MLFDDGKIASFRQDKKSKHKPVSMHIFFFQPECSSRSNCHGFKDLPTGFKTLGSVSFKPSEYLVF